MQTIAIIDYGSGNLRSAAKAFERSARESGVDAEIAVTDDVAGIARADRVVLPGDRFASLIPRERQTGTMSFQTGSVELDRREASVLSQMLRDDLINRDAVRHVLAG